MCLSSSVGNASSFLHGIQATRVSFNGPCAEISGPQSAKPRLFSGEPASFFTGVVAVTVGCSTRRWNCGGGRVAQLGRSQDFSVEKLSAGQVVCGTGNDALPDKLETGRRWEEKPTRCDPKCGQRVGAVAAALEDDRLSMVLEAGVLEDDRLSTVSETDAAAVEALSSRLRVSGSDEAQQLEQSGCRTARSAGPGRHARAERGVQHAPRFEREFDGALSQTTRSSGAGALVRARRQRADALGAGDAPPLGRRALRRFRQACVERAEAGSDNFDVVPSFTRCESHTARSHRVDVTMHENLLCTSSGCRTACTTHNLLACDTGVHGAMQRVIRFGRNSGNSFNSWRDTEEGGLHCCEPGRTKSLSTSTQCGVRRSAVDESAHTQQAPLKLHEETWTGLLQNQGLRISQEVEIVPECAVSVARLACRDNSPVSPGPGRVIRNMLGWTLEELTVGSGVWLFRGALKGKNFRISIIPFAL